jgi:hypothetical protein
MGAATFFSAAYHSLFGLQRFAESGASASREWT